MKEHTECMELPTLGQTGTVVLNKTLELQLVFVVDLSSSLYIYIDMYRIFLHAFVSKGAVQLGWVSHPHPISVFIFSGLGMPLPQSQQAQPLPLLRRWSRASCCRRCCLVTPQSCFPCGQSQGTGRWPLVSPWRRGWVSGCCGCSRRQHHHLPSWWQWQEQAALWGSPSCLHLWQAQGWAFLAFQSWGPWHQVCLHFGRCLWNPSLWLLRVATGRHARGAIPALLLCPAAGESRGATWAQPLGAVVLGWFSRWWCPIWTWYSTWKKKQSNERSVKGQSKPVPFYLEATEEDRRQNWKTVGSLFRNWELYSKHLLQCLYLQKHQTSQTDYHLWLPHLGSACNEDKSILAMYVKPFVSDKIYSCPSK